MNHRARRVQGLVAHRSVGDLPEVPELVVVATPADAVLAVARDCALKGVKALLVLSGGFTPAPAGRKHRSARKQGGQNCPKSSAMETA